MQLIMKINSKIFKAYDVRGKYPEEINEEAVFEIVRRFSKIFRGKIVVGRDARLSSPSLYKAVLRGLRGEPKVKSKKLLYPLPPTLYPVGIITTPMLYFLVNHLKADGGIMVTASHNPKEYNGLKVVGKNARPISGLTIRKLVIK